MVTKPRTRVEHAQTRKGHTWQVVLEKTGEVLCASRRAFPTPKARDEDLELVKWALIYQLPVDAR